MPANYVLISEITTNALTTSVTFANIPQTGYTDLKIVMSVRVARTGTLADSIGYRFNNSTTGYSQVVLYGNGSSTPSSFTLSTFTPAGETWGRLDGGTINTADTTANTFTSIDMYIPNYTSNSNKSFTLDLASENNSSTAYIETNAGIWSDSSAITSISFRDNNLGALVAGCTFSLYGIAALGTTPTVLPKATGGDIVVNDGTYWYHAFLSSGVFTTSSALSCDVLQVAGGGGGAGYGGGGGAGGLLGFTSQALTSATNYVATVGAGGTATAYNAPNTGNGNNSQLGSLTASVGGGGGGSSTNYRAGNSGGSGGGSGSHNPGNGTVSGGLGTSTQGNNGGAGTSEGNAWGSGGGGGASAVGATTTGKGGVGATFNTTVGTSSGPYSFINAMGSATATGQLSSGNYYYAGGGSGHGSVTTQTGGLGGGGSGGYAGGETPGTANTGGGGGAGNGNASAGGSGIIIVRYTMV